jgi:hypothetical protein
LSSRFKRDSIIWISTGIVSIFFFHCPVKENDSSNNDNRKKRVLWYFQIKDTRYLIHPHGSCFSTCLCIIYIQAILKGSNTRSKYLYKIKAVFSHLFNHFNIKRH